MNESVLVWDQCRGAKGMHNCIRLIFVCTFVFGALHLSIARRVPNVKKIAFLFYTF